MIKKNILPERWVVLNDGSDKFMSSVIPYLNGAYNGDFKGDLVKFYYGIIPGDPITHNGVAIRKHLSKEVSSTILSLDKFIELVKAPIIGYKLKKPSQTRRTMVQSLGCRLDENDMMDISQSEVISTLFKENLICLWFEIIYKLRALKWGDREGVYTADSKSFKIEGVELKINALNYLITSPSHRNLGLTSFGFSDSVILSRDDIKYIISETPPSYV